MTTRPQTASRHRPYLLDVSRLIWRRWSGVTPTGIDRFCLAYAAEFAPQALAFVQRGERRIALTPDHSDALFALLLDPPVDFRGKLARLLARAALSPRRQRIAAGTIYLNVGHTGIDAPGLGEWLARRGIERVYLIHDLIPITHPRYCRAGEEERHRARMTQALRSATGLILNSAYTRDELERFAHDNRLAMPPALVVWPGIESLGEAAPLPAMTRPFFLCIGTIEARKNHALLLDVWDRLRAATGSACPDLVLVGRRGWEAGAIHARIDSDTAAVGRVIEYSRADDALLAALIDRARAVLMPSHVEGFGLPVLEALARGTPVLASDIPVHREIAGAHCAGGMATLLPADDEAAWAGALADCMRPNGPRPSHAAAERTRAPVSVPDWEEHFGTVRRWLDQLG